jgi:hypothetical protein
MKKFIAWVLLYSLILQLSGCYSFSEIEQINDTVLTELKNQTLKITLSNGKVYFLEPNQHTNNIRNSDFIIGKGMVYMPKLTKLGPFEGTIYRGEIDSQRIESNTLYIWLKNQNRITMDKGDYFIFAPEMKRGIWVLDNPNMECISVDEIIFLEREYLNIYTTVLCILGISVTVFFYFLAKSLSGFPFGNSKKN